MNQQKDIQNQKIIKSICLPPDILKRSESMAKKQSRSFSGYVTAALKEYNKKDVDLFHPNA